MKDTASGSSGLPSSSRLFFSSLQFVVTKPTEDFSLLPCPPASPLLAKVVAETLPPPPGGAEAIPSLTKRSEI